jgi:hypothetical protein
MIALAILFKPKIESQAPPSSDDLEFPTVDETRKIPVIFGTVKMKSLAVIWAGNNFRYEKMEKSGGLFGDDVTLGYRYFISLACAISFGEIRLKKIYFKDAVGYQYFSLQNPNENSLFSEGYFDYSIDKRKLFKTESTVTPDDGVSGYFNFFSGTSNQPSSNHINSIFGLNKLPSFKNLSYLVFKDFYWGNNRVLPQVDVEVERVPNNVCDGEDYFIEDSQGNKDANPVEILFDIMTNEEFYGVSIPADRIDKESFKEAGRVLKEENFGLSLIFEGGSSFEDIKKDIEKHVSCNLFMSYLTGKWTIKLNRQDYDINTIKTIDISNIKSINKYTKTEISSLSTELKIDYTDRTSDYKKRTISAKSPTVLRLRGNPKIQDDSFLACKDRNLASKIVSREIKAYSKPLISLEVIVDRTAFGLQIGDVINVNYPKYNINNKIFRITEVDLGEFNKRQIKLSLIEDIFTFGDEVVEANEDGLYEPPTDVDYTFDSFNFEAPILFGEQHNMISCLENHSNRSEGFKVYLEEDGERIIRANSNNTTSYGIIKNQFTKNQNSFNIQLASNTRDFDLNVIEETTNEERLYGRNFAVITDGTNQEFISFRRILLDSINDRYIVEDVWRGCIDTIPKNWNSGSKIYFLDYGSVNLLLDNTNTDGIIKTFDIVRKFSTKEDEIYLDDQTIQFNRRFYKPFYPYLLTINSSIYGTNETIDNFETYSVIPLNTDLQLTWGNADRTKSIQYVNRFNIPTSTNEDNTVYNLRIYDDTDTLIKTENGLTSQSYTFADETTINPALTHYDKLRFELETERDGILSKEVYNVKIIRQ